MKRIPAARLKLIGKAHSPQYAQQVKDRILELGTVGLRRDGRIRH
jgi:hypothetical protein